MIQRQQFPGMMRGLMQQQPQGGQPQAPQWGPQAGANSWGGQQMQMQRGQGQLQGLARQLGQQAWGDPGPGAAVIQNPGAQRQMAPNPQQAAQQYAQGQAQGLVNERDPRFSGAIR